MLIECAPQMFETLANPSIDDDDDDDAQITTGFQLVMRACQRFYQSKIISNDKDLSGIILYGTEKSSNAFEFKHIYILQELAQPSAERIIQLESLSQRETFRSKYAELFGSTQHVRIYFRIHHNV